jgi:hypothetical protein
MPGPAPLRTSCPNCGSQSISRDGSTALLFVCSWLLPPFTWLLFMINPNVVCNGCGVRFKK